MSVIINH